MGKIRVKEVIKTRYYLFFNEKGKCLENGDWFPDRPWRFNSPVKKAITACGDAKDPLYFGGIQLSTLFFPIPEDAFFIAECTKPSQAMWVTNEDEYVGGDPMYVVADQVKVGLPKELGDVEVFKELVTNAVGINIINYLYWAIRNNYTATVMKILHMRNGRDISIQLMYALSSLKEATNFSGLLSPAVENNNYKVYKELRKIGAFIPSGLIELAARKGNVHTVKDILDAGFRESYALHLALSRGHVEVAKLLMSYGIDSPGLARYIRKHGWPKEVPSVS